MPSGYRTKAGTDFDDEFDFYVQGDIGTTTGRQSSDGNDLNRRYAPLAYGAKAPDVGHRDATGSDLSNRWARKGSASYSLACNGVTYVGSSTALTSEGGTQIGRVSFAARANGTWSIGVEGSSTGGDPRSGTWLPNGQAASNYEVQYQLDISWSQGNKAGTTQNDAANYATLTSDFAAVVTASASSGSGQECYGGGRLTIRIRNKSTGTVNTTTITIRAEAAGHR